MAHWRDTNSNSYSVDLPYDGDDNDAAYAALVDAMNEMAASITFDWVYDYPHSLESSDSSDHLRRLSL